jgi:hypothetical protein
MSQLAPPDTAIRAEILALRAAGAAFHQIAARLNGRGLKGQNGGRWYAASVRRAVLALAGAAGMAERVPHRCTARCRQRRRDCPLALQDQSHTHRSFSGEVHARINATPVAAGLVAD